MRHYLQTKAQYGDALLFYRLGDFYEMFFDDAETVSRELNLVLTGRDCGLDERAPMCGVPYHAAETYIARLIAKGYKVAICEQLEDPAKAKGMVKRDVIRVVTPGTVTESSMLTDGSNNFLGVVCADKSGAGVCFCDISTGEFHITQFSGPKGLTQASGELLKFSPKELILTGTAAKNDEIKDYLSAHPGIYVSQENEDLTYQASQAVVLAQTGASSLAQISLDNREYCTRAFAIALSYLAQTQKSDALNIRQIDVYDSDLFMRLDDATRSNLELTSSQSEVAGSTLLAVLNKAKTPMGRRLLRLWIEQPLVDPIKINLRQNAVEEIFLNSSLRTGLEEKLTGIGDIERIITRVSGARTNPAEVDALRTTMEKIPALRALLDDCSSRLLDDCNKKLDDVPQICALIKAAICDNPPQSTRDGNFIREGFNAELDELRSIATGGKDYMARLQLEEQEKTGIKKLKIGYNRVYGYYFEVPNTYKELVPDTYIRKQTLTNGERYINEELKTLESRVLGATERMVRLENEIFGQICEKITENRLLFSATASAVAVLDVLYSLAESAVENDYVRPVVDTSDVIDIKAGRHPVVEKTGGLTLFVPNDTYIDRAKHRTLLITGPNMAGKSTYMRQTALIVLMAQIGSFVPAKSARIGVADAIYTRIGARDNLSGGQSTFMVEMSEVSYILKNATKRSLILLDEIGRGTSTFDGMSIARAVLEYISKMNTRTMFSTHYHELTGLEDVIDGVFNCSASVKRRADGITFLRRIVPGPSDGSFGVEVARLAGLPKSVTSRASQILEELERNGAQSKEIKHENTENQISFYDDRARLVLAAVKDIDPDTLTPLEALNKIYEIKEIAGD